MVSRMKNFNILGIHWKIQFLEGHGGRVHEKAIQSRWLLKNGGLDSLPIQEGTWQEVEGEGDTPMHTM